MGRALNDLGDKTREIYCINLLSRFGKYKYEAFVLLGAGRNKAAVTWQHEVESPRRFA